MFKNVVTMVIAVVLLVSASASMVAAESHRVNVTSLVEYRARLAKDRH